MMSSLGLFIDALPSFSSTRTFARDFIDLTAIKAVVEAGRIALVSQVTIPVIATQSITID